ncbi:MAG: DUF4256 domain-containing protein [Sphaerochaetaceae bacterium]
MGSKKRRLSPKETDVLLSTLKVRFLKNMERHQDFEWEEVKTKLLVNDDKLVVLHAMERTGGEPDLIAFDAAKGGAVYVDCSPESPIGRRNVCYDRKGLESRKEHRPQFNALDMASEIGIEILNEAEYRSLQEFGKFDTKTSSWIKTPEIIRGCGSALFCDRRCDTVFVYHNGAQSYYSSRGFRGLLRL